MKPTNLNPLFIDHVPDFAHLLTTENQTKEQFSEKVKITYSNSNPKAILFHLSILQSDFDTIRLSSDKNSILFNHSNDA